MKAYKRNKILKKSLGVFSRIAAIFFAIVLLVVALLNVPAIQTFITQKIAARINAFYHVDMSLGAIKIALPKTISIGQLFVAGRDRDTLLFVERLDVNLGILALINHEVNVHALEIENLNGNVFRGPPGSDFNFQFLLDAFTKDSVPPVNPEAEKPSEPWKISVGKISLSSIKGHYRDETLGIDTRLNLGNFALRFKSIDLNDLAFVVEELNLKNTSAKLEQWTVSGNQSAEADLEENSGGNPEDALPQIRLNHLSIENVEIGYEDLGGGLSFWGDVGYLKLDPVALNLAKNNISIGDFAIADSRATMTMAGDTTQHEADTTKPSKENNSANQQEIAFLPDWNIDLSSMQLNRVSFGMDNKNAKAVESGIDFNHLLLENINLDLEKFAMAHDHLGFRINRLDFTEKSGVGLKSMRCQLSLTNDSASIKDLEIQTALSAVKGNFQTHFENISKLTENPGLAVLDLDLQSSSINTSELFFMAGLNPEDSALSQYKNLDVKISAAIDGLVDHLDIRKFDIALLDRTKIKTRGRLNNLTRPEKLAFSIIVDTLATYKNELFRLTDSSYFDGITLPDALLIGLSASGTPDSVRATMNLGSGIGDVHAHGYYAAAGPIKPDSIFLNLDLKNLNAGKLLSDTTMGTINLSLELAGSGFEADAMALQTKGTIHSAGYMNYTYQNIDFEGALKESKIHADITSHDPNAQLHFIADADLANDGKIISSTLDVGVLNFSGLNLSDKISEFRGKIELDGSYTSLSDLSAEISISRGQIVRENHIFNLEPVFIRPVIRPDSTLFDFRSQLLNLNFKSNMSPGQMDTVLTLAAKKYLGLSDTLELPAGKTIDFDMDISFPEAFRTYFLSGLNEISFDSIHGHYSSDNNKLNVIMRAPEIKWDKFDVSDWHLKIDGVNDSLVFSSGLQNMFYDTLLIGKISIRELISRGEVKSSISIAGDQGESDYLLQNNIYVSDDLVKLSFAENGLILNGESWVVPPDNAFEFGDSVFTAREFVFTQGIQSFGIETSENANIVKFENFDLSNLLSIVKIPDDMRIFNGTLNAHIELPLVQQYAGVEANVAVNDFQFLQTHVGDIQFSLSEEENDLDMELSLENDQNKITAEGTMGKSAYPQKVDFNIEVDIGNPKNFEVFSLGEISNAEGSISGKIKVGGNVDDPLIQGSVNFKDTRMRINKLNLMATLQDETINFDRKGMNVKNFTLLDDKGGRFSLDGKVQTKDYLKYQFDLTLSAKDFQPINSTKKDNPVFYGAFIFDAEINLSGDTELPKIDAEIEVKEGTDFTYVMPGSEIEMISSEGIVNFVRPNDNPDSVFRVSRNDYFSDSIMSKFEGLDISARLQVHPEARFTVVIDPVSGDYSSVSGKANLYFMMDPSGTQTLTGVFEVSKGIYQLSFYGLVKKTFNFQSGSTIAWSGNLMDASLNFTASNVVRTQSVALVANESANMTEAELNMFKQRLPYEVLLNLKGFIMEPDVSFNISLPEKYQVNYPAIASKLTLLNSGQYESELNKQVFALLVTGSFIADNPYASTGGTVESFATTAARNSVNGILADQLNKMSSRYIKNVDMNFGLTSYEDFSGNSSQVRTELDVEVSKKMMNDRLVVEASGSFDVEGERQYTSTSTSHTYGEFSATYNLTESGDYKLRAYRENAYDLFDGEVSYSGLAFIIEKSFQSLFKRKKEDVRVNQESPPEKK